MKKSTIKSIVKFFLVKSLKLAGWKVWLAMHAIDILYAIFVKPLLKESERRSVYDRKVIERKMLYDTLISKKDQKDLLESIKKHIITRKNKKRQDLD